ncbi:MarR family winged helix-turn-helix transcriptional regulator [Desulfobacula toluolica]|nr:MarR family transcriptional regulator [Desulfobacula toluolica]
MTSHVSEIKPGKIIHNLFLEVFALHDVLFGIMDKVHEQAGLATSQHKVILVLTHTGPVTVPDIADRLGVSRQFVQTVCNQLSSRGFLQFIDNPRHKRSKLAVLTDPGRTAFQAAQQKENEIIERALPDLDPEKTAQACRLLKTIRQSLPSG